MTCTETSSTASAACAKHNARRRTFLAAPTAFVALRHKSTEREMPDRGRTAITGVVVRRRTGAILRHVRHQ
jgi:hypothetical protein